MYNIYFEVAAAGFVALLLLYLHLQYPNETESNKRYRQMVAWLLAADLMDVITARMIDYGQRIPPLLNTLANTLYFMTSAGMALAFVKYMDAFVKSDKNRYFVRFGNITFGAYMLLMTTNIFTGWVFSFDEKGNYIHGPVYFVSFSALVAIGMSALTLLWTYRAHLERRQKMAFWMFFSLLAAGSVLQLALFPKTVLVFYMGSIAAMTFLFINETPDYLRLTATMKELEKQRQKADSANNAKSDFLAKMSHEIRTPINVVIGMDEMILRDAESEDIKSYELDIKDSAEVLLTTINDILDLSKVESGRMELVPVEYGITGLLSDVSKMMGFRAQQKNLIFRMDLDESAPSVLFGDDVRIRQVLINLLTNAIKYTEEGSVTLGLRASRDQENVILHYTIMDTGIGIKKEDQEKLFEQYARLDEEKNRHIEGTGLGMSITVSLLHMMGSELHVDSTYGKGSTFYFDLRQTIVDDTPIGNLEKRMEERAAESEQHVYYTVEDATILLVDDNALNRRVVKNLLRDTGIMVEEAEGGYECIERVKEKRYDLILLDHMMPDLNGVEALHRMKENGMYRCEGVPVVMLTANAISGAKEMYEKEGFDAFLEKPIRPEGLDGIMLEYLPKEKIRIGEKARRTASTPVTEMSNVLRQVTEPIRFPEKKKEEAKQLIHIFLVNTNAGKSLRSDRLREELSQIKDVESFVFNIRHPRGEAEQIREILPYFEQDKKVRIYCCGGSGTLCNTLNGIEKLKDVEIAFFPCGLTNDFLKVYGMGQKAFFDIRNLIYGEVVPTDYIRTNAGVLLNAFSLGLDSRIIRKMDDYRAFSIFSPQLPYVMGGINSVFLTPQKEYRVVLDDEKEIVGKMAEIFFGNGRVIGGRVHMTKDVSVTDGLANVTLIRDRQFLSMLPPTLATMSDNQEKVEKYCYTDKAHKILVERTDGKPFESNFDGELQPALSRWEAEIVPQGLQFVVPKGVEL